MAVLLEAKSLPHIWEEKLETCRTCFPKGVLRARGRGGGSLRELGEGVSRAAGLSKDDQETAVFLLSERQTAVLRSGPGKNAQITRGIMVHPQHSV